MSRKLISALIRELKSNYEGNPWFGDSMQTILYTTREEIVFVHPIPEAHSIAEILAHVIAWRELLRQRLQGNNAYSVKQKESFDWRRIDPNRDTAWNSLLQALEDNQQQILDTLQASGDELLKKKTAGRSYTLGRFIRHIMLHDTYHLGQIALLRKYS